MTPPDPRRTAWMILNKSLQSKRTLDHILEQHAPLLDEMSRRNRALANAIIFGTLRWKGRLDGILAPFSRKPLDKVDPAVKWILRMALFQIIHMDKIPASAAVNTAVTIAAKEIHRGAAGFVNAVLRQAAAKWSTLSPPDAAASPDHYIAMEKSLPLWLARRWHQRFGMDKTLALADAVNTIPPITLRINPLKTHRDALMAQIGPWVNRMEKTAFSPWGLRIWGPRRPIHTLSAFTSGLFQVQDEGAQLVTALLLDPQPGERILDACAGLGGKTGHMAQLMKNQGEVVAMDTDPGKLTRLEQEMQRLGITMVVPRHQDLLKHRENRTPTKRFDRVLVDAPCSGLGVMRRNPDTKWKRSKKDIARLAIKQEKILTATAPLVRPGGRLVYVVCSCEPRENEKVVHHFLEKHPEFTVVPPAKSHDGTEMPACDGVFFRTFPDFLEMDGFFAAAMKRDK